jgi:hypothetical protein
MVMWPSLAFGAFLILLSCGLVVSHIIARRWAEEHVSTEPERTYRRRQFRRRMHASALIGGVGAAVIGGLWVDAPPGEALYWSGVLLAAIWILILAGADISSTQSFLRESQRQRTTEEETLTKFIEHHHRHQDDGKHF